MCLWEIHFYQLENGGIIGRGVYDRKYKRKGNAIRVAMKVYGDKTKYRWFLMGRAV